MRCKQCDKNGVLNKRRGLRFLKKLYARVNAFSERISNFVTKASSRCRKSFAEAYIKYANTLL